MFRNQTSSDPAWVERYGRRVDDYRLPATDAARQAYAEQSGRDGHALLAAVAAPDAPARLRELPAVETLRRVWVQNFAAKPDPEADGSGGQRGCRVVWRTTTEGCPPSLLYVASPYDADVHFAKKRTTRWIGYKVHLTETCEEDQPHLVTHVETTPAPVVDRDVVARACIERSTRTTYCRASISAPLLHPHSRTRPAARWHTRSFFHEKAGFARATVVATGATARPLVMLPFAL